MRRWKENQEILMKPRCRSPPRSSGLMKQGWTSWPQLWSIMSEGKPGTARNLPYADGEAWQAAESRCRGGGGVQGAGRLVRVEAKPEQSQSTDMLNDDPGEERSARQTGSLSLRTMTLIKSTRGSGELCERGPGKKPDLNPTEHLRRDLNTSVQGPGRGWEDLQRRTGSNLQNEGMQSWAEGSCHNHSLNYLTLRSSLWSSSCGAQSFGFSPGKQTKLWISLRCCRFPDQEQKSFFLQTCPSLPGSISPLRLIVILPPHKTPVIVSTAADWALGPFSCSKTTEKPKWVSTA